jgi:hypothetical protein
MNIFRKPSFDPLRLAKRENRRDDGYLWYAVEPAVMYPAVIRRIQQAMLISDPPPELLEHYPAPGSDPRSVATGYLEMAWSLPAVAFEYALRERSSFTNQIEISQRAQALSLARLWFTQALKEAVAASRHQPASIGLHILKDERYRLS